MNEDIVQVEWPRIRERIQAAWSKFSLRDVDSFKFNLDGIVGKIEEIYGHGREQAQREYHEFQLSLRTLLHPVTQLGRPVPVVIPRFRMVAAQRGILAARRRS